MMSTKKVVLDAWHKYQFPERSLKNSKGDRLEVCDPVIAYEDLDFFVPSKIDASERGEMKQVVNVVGQMIAASETEWFGFSPLEVYLEKVFAQRLKTFEPGDF